MRAVIFDHYGEPDVLSVQEVPIPEPQDDEVLIRVGYAGVNPSDSKARSGESARRGYRVRGVDFPFVTGMDAAGVVERVGANVTNFRQGDRVITCGAADGKTWGSYAEFMRVPARHVFPIPKSLSFEQAATVPVSALTAYQSLFLAEKGGMIPGQRVLIHGAAGGVGSFAVQFAKSGGLWVAATCSSCNVAYIRSLGADHVIDYKTEDVGRAVRDWSGAGVDVVVDLVGSTSLPNALDMLRPGGRLVSILTVTADGDIERDRNEAERRGFSKIPFIINFDRAQDSLRQITQLIDAGLIRVPPIHVLALEEAARAHQMIETGHVRGKLVLKVADLSLSAWQQRSRSGS